ncbi:MAG TPA: XrtA system polysaccharide deacetylase [Gemmatimonadales bacterium]|jgi:polysaccharide deacetylase family protein (PEP-CTERM system associated)
MTTHFFTVDVEEHFQVQALAPYVSRDAWGTMESRVEANTRRILELCAEHGARGTFFTVGWVAERHPALVKAIAAAGHELASHTWDHKRIPEQSRDAFRDSVRRTRELLEDLSGTPCIGFRAPSYSIVRGFEWALDVLLETGYRYDSSLFPVTRPGYGYSGGARDPHWLDRPAGRLAEVPPATLRRLGANLPAAGGAYFRLLPYALVAAALRQAAHRNRPATFYIHPWEIDPGQPRVKVPALTAVRHYGGLGRTEGRLARLLSEFSFTAIAPGFGLGHSAVPA